MLFELAIKEKIDLGKYEIASPKDTIAGSYYGVHQGADFKMQENVAAAMYSVGVHNFSVS